MRLELLSEAVFYCREQQAVTIRGGSPYLGDGTQPEPRTHCRGRDECREQRHHAELGVPGGGAAGMGSRRAMHVFSDLADEGQASITVTRPPQTIWQEGEMG